MSHPIRAVALFLACVVLGTAACGDSGSAGAENGGAANIGGAGGSTATGGTTGGSGSPASGAGGVGTGGSAGTGGAVNRGGAGGVGAEPDASSEFDGGNAAGGGTSGRDSGRPGADAAGPAEAGNPGNPLDAATTYDPCPTDGTPCKILPLGDSITWGIQFDGAYRVELFSKAVGQNKRITFTGSLTNGPTTVASMPFPRSNEGHSGWTIDQIAGLIPNPALSTLPNIVLMMIGTNDVYAASGQSAMPTRLGSLIDKITAAAPNALLVVAKITPLSMASWNATIKTYNDAMPALVQTRVAAGKHLMLVDMNTNFVVSSMLSTDGIHPNQTGYNFMGDVWFAAIGPLLH